ncbi:phage regulatory CII family protein [Burkholderia sp. Bp9142]|uniref:phage regulatory CII family protein n=1 Tax=Burkholderia sp. Bp9142 TaxID=2184573 RepID=UPI000F5ABE1A|nr:phage regulatory CII family protein [Burkholderia sp. Bp9142]RQR37839.1 hypothetical protein DIE22_10105 [Burkholderia sp. Bp9142]
MTCRYSGTDWLDVLYTSVRNTPGGVADAALFLTARRGRSISVESLRLRLRAVDENRLSMEMFELLIEWMEEHGSPHAHDALYALNERFGLRATNVDAAEGQDTVHALVLQALDLTHQTGVVMNEVRGAVADGKITTAEAEAVTVAARAHQRMADQLIDAVVRLSKLGRS